MKAKQITRKWGLRMTFFVILFSTLSMQKMYSLEGEGDEIIVDGDWPPSSQSSTRSLSIPISVYTDGSYIYIENTRPDCDITVTIYKDAVEYEETFSKESTSYIVIPINHLSVGIHTLEMTNPYGGYLTGMFHK